MRLYFFVTKLEPDPAKPSEMKMRLKPLPNQTFDDGTPVDVNYNVQSPKERGSHPGGTREEYAIEGAYFCSNILRETEGSRGGKFYSVYDEDNNELDIFNVVSDDPNFTYVNPSHRNDKLNMAFTMFMNFGEQETEEEEEQKTHEDATAADGRPIRYNPVVSGKARKPLSNWTPTYPGQMESEAELVCLWLKKFMRDNAIMIMKTRPAIDATTLALFKQLFECGENAETLASAERFKEITKKEHVAIIDLGQLDEGPLSWYLGNIISEHMENAPATVKERSAESDSDITDLTYLLVTHMNRQTGVPESPDNDALKQGMKQAIESGWSLSDMLMPETSINADSTNTLLTDIISGKCPKPNVITEVNEKTVLELLHQDVRFNKPQAEDGFCITDKKWDVLTFNLNQKEWTLITGPSGSGKTQVVKILCQRAGIPCTIIPLGNITEPSEQLVGKMDLATATETRFDWAEFALAIQRPGVVLLDEINRMPRNGSNLLLSVLDDTRALPAFGAKGSDTRMIPVHPDCMFVATANIGEEFTGTDELDEALRTRFMPLEMDYLDQKSEIEILCTRTGITREDATNICMVANEIREAKRQNTTLSHDISTRETLRCAKYVKGGWSVRDAIEVNFLPIFQKGTSDKDPDSERGLVYAIIAKRFDIKSTSSGAKKTSRVK